MPGAPLARRWGAACQRSRPTDVPIAGWAKRRPVHPVEGAHGFRRPLSPWAPSTGFRCGVGSHLARASIPQPERWVEARIRCNTCMAMALPGLRRQHGRKPRRARPAFVRRACIGRRRRAVRRDGGVVRHRARATRWGTRGGDRRAAARRTRQHAAGQRERARRGAAHVGRHDLRTRHARRTPGHRDAAAPGRFRPDSRHDSPGDSHHERPFTGTRYACKSCILRTPREHSPCWNASRRSSPT